MSLARSYREGNGNPLQYSCLENPMDGGAWQAVVHGVAERLHFYFSLSCIGEGNATHSSVLAWRIPGMGEPGGLQSMELQSRTRLKRLSSSSSSSSKVTRYMLDIQKQLPFCILAIDSWKSKFFKVVCKWHQNEIKV